MKSKQKCQGCYYNDYNHGLGGSKGCWNYESAIMKLRKRVHMSQVPPWNQEPEMMKSCYTAEQWVFVDGDRTN